MRDRFHAGAFLRGRILQAEKHLARALGSNVGTKNPASNVGKKIERENDSHR